ncbi:hypothetical protein Tco_1484134 [Tanacetum coccineum]
MVKPVWNNAQKVNHQNFAKKTHPCAKKNLVSRAVLMKSSLVSVNTDRQVNTAHSKTTVNATRPMSYLSKTTHSTVKRPINNNTTFKNCNINQMVNTVRGKNVNNARPKVIVNAVQGNNVNAVKASACWVWKLKTKVLDHVSKHNSESTILKRAIHKWIYRSRRNETTNIILVLRVNLKLGLWYPKDSPFDLVAYTDSDYARASLDRKSTTGEAEYVAASSCCGQVL